MLHVIKSRWRNRWHVYDVDTGGIAWVATFRQETDAYDWVRKHYSLDD